MPSSSPSSTVAEPGDDHGHGHGHGHAPRTHAAVSMDRVVYSMGDGEQQPPAASIPKARFGGGRQQLQMQQQQMHLRPPGHKCVLLGDAD